MIKMSYALKAGHLISVDEVESGLACQCTCPSCGARLVARKGSIKIHHFAHAKNQDCGHGTESSLHLLAKEILQEEKRLFLPEIYLKNHKFGMISESKIIHFDTVELEKRINELVPDVTLYSKNIPLIIEVKVTHGIDDIKEEKIKQSDISVVEIDLSKKKDIVSKEELRKILLEDTQTKKWIYNKKQEYYENIIRDISEKVIIYSKDTTTKGTSKCPINRTHAFFKYYSKSEKKYKYLYQQDCLGSNNNCNFCYKINFRDIIKRSDEEKISDEKFDIHHPYDIEEIYCLAKLKIMNFQDLKKYINSRKK